MPQAIRSRQSTHGTAEVVGASVLVRKDGELLEFVSARPGWLVYENDQQRCYTLGPVLPRGRGGHIIAKTPPQRLR
jgi:hypothetical protein